MRATHPFILGIGLKRTRGIPIAPFAALAFGLNACLLFAGVALVALVDNLVPGSGEYAAAAVPVGLILLPGLICYCVATGRAVSRWLMILQGLCLVLVFGASPWVLPFLLLYLWAWIAPAPIRWYSALLRGDVTEEETKQLPQWPANTLAVMDWVAAVLPIGILLLAVYAIVMPAVVTGNY